MKKMMAKIIVFVLLQMISSMAFAYIEPSDHLLDDQENAIYMIGWIYSRITGSERDPNNANIIYKINLKDNSKDIFYESYRVDRLTLSPNNKYIAVIKGAGSFVKTNEMLIIDKKEKREIASFKDDIRKYSWSPSGKEIIYITGEDIEGNGLRPTGVWIYDITKKEKKKIAERALEIEWLPNNDIYLIDYHIEYRKKGEAFVKGQKNKVIFDTVIYNYDLGAVKSKGVKGVKFSFDGRYSIVLNSDYFELPGDNDESVRIDFYDLQMKKEIPRESLSNIFREASRIYWESFFWTKNNRIIYTKKIGGKAMFNEIIIGAIENNSILKTSKGYLVGTNSDRSKLVIYSDGKFSAVDVP